MTDNVAEIQKSEESHRAVVVSTKPITIGGVNIDFFMRDGQKHDQNKPRFSLIPHKALWQVVEVLEFGANKYGADNWRHVPNARERYFNAAHRHLNAWWAGEKVDSESGLPHLAHAVCCLMFLMWFDGDGK
ncbi:dATP/dGTP diphosphohydrolase domain-containing protein [Moraxella bovoculi]|nr:dATP/dGTP diphosphohydrolase domain-containing protein [Moraxella bovoculi]